MKRISLPIIFFSLLPSLATATLIEDKATMLANIQEEIHQINTRMKSSEKQQRELEGLLRKSETALSDQQRTLRKTKRALAETQSALKAAEEKEIQLNTYFKDHQAELRRLMVARYRMKAKAPIQLLLSNPSLADTERLIRYFNHYFSESQTQLDVVKQKLAELKNTKKKILAKKSRLDELKAEQALVLKRLSQENRKRQIILTALNDAIHSDEMRIRRLREDETALVALLRRLESTDGLPDASFPFQGLKGALPWPTVGKIKTARQAFGFEGNHRNGIFIETQGNQSVKAVHAGQVVFADWMRGYGLLVIVDHQDGYLSLYAHNDALYQQAGNWVEPNEVIAKVGKSGGHEKIGLYFEIRKDSKPLVVKDWLQG